jgi:putative DNA primase/helicase
VSAAVPRLAVNDDAERAVLGSILIDSRAVLPRLDGLRPDDFATAANAAIYVAALAVAARGQGADLITVQSELEHIGRLEAAGGAAYLAGLVDRVPDVDNVEAYASIVRDDAERRRLSPVFTGAAGALGGRAAVADVLANVERALPRKAKDWPEPQPLPPEADAVPTLGDELLPEALRPWLADAAERVSIPLEFVAAPALVALGSVVGRSCALRPMARDDWREVPNLWGGIVGPPGVMKSAALAEAMRPLSRLAHEAAATFEETQRGREAALEVVKARREAVRDAMRKAAGKDDSAALEKKKSELEDLAAEEERGEVAERRFYTSDATIEKLGALLKVNPRGLLVTRDELTGWLRTLDREDRAESRAFFLESWNGTGRFTVDRIGRGTVHVEGLCLSVLGGIQPGRLRPYVAGAIAGDEDADGLLQRFSLLVWPDTFGEWRNVDRWADRDARDRAFGVFSSLAAFEPRSIGAEIEDGDALPFFRFDPEAQGLFLEWRHELERRLRSDEMTDAPAFCSHLAKYRTLVPSLALLFHLADAVDGGRGGAVAAPALRLALSWADFLEAHARKLYAPELSPGVSAAHALAAKIEAGKVPDGMTIRTVAEHDWSGLRTSDRVSAAAAELERLGWLRVETLTPGDLGGRPSAVLRLNPALRRAK